MTPDEWNKMYVNEMLIHSGANSVVRGDPKMDFEVGDVVRFKDGRDPETVTIESLYTGASGDLCVTGVKQNGGRCDGWYANRFELVSRPSEAKPALKVGDRVRVKGGLDYSGLEGVISAPAIVGPDWYVDSGTHRHRYQFNASVLELLPPEPAKLKVGDEVTFVRGVWSGQEGVLDDISPAGLVTVRQPCGKGILSNIENLALKPARQRLTPSLHESGAGIAKLNLPKPPAKHRERLMTTSWAPYGEWDNLPDAD